MNVVSNLDIQEIIKWIVLIGIPSLLGTLLYANAQFREIKVKQAKAETQLAFQRQEAEEAHAREARFEADIAASTTKVAGEGILRGLMLKLVEREQASYNAVEMVNRELVLAREEKATLRESLAELQQQENNCQRNLSLLRDAQMNQQRDHEHQMRTLRNRIYTMGHRLQAAGGLLTGTDIFGAKPTEEPQAPGEAAR